MSAEFDQLVAQFERFQATMRGAEDRMAGLEAMQREVEDLTAQAQSPDGSVTVIAGPGGAIRDIRFTEAALRGRAQALGATVMATLGAAVAEVARRQAAIVDAHSGGELGLLDQVARTQAEIFGTSPEEIKSKVAREQPDAAADPAKPDRGSAGSVDDADEAEDFDDFAEETVLRPAAGPSGSAGDGSAGERFLRNLDDEKGH